MCNLDAEYCGAVSLEAGEPLCFLGELSQIVPAEIDFPDRTHVCAGEVGVPQGDQELKAVARHVDLIDTNGRRAG